MKPRHISNEDITAPLMQQPISGRGSQASVRSSQGVKVEESVVITRPPAELFAFWRNFENLPRVLQHVESVKIIDGGRSHWRAHRPNGGEVEWDAEIINEHPNELIAWRTLEGSDVHHAGTIRFAPQPDGRGTQVKLAMEYEAPGSKFIQALAKLFGRSVEQQVREDLRRFKQLMETGESPP